ncbi:MAG: hypothetical protein V8S36_04815 [Lachnospiraceae bacterium]
MAKEKILLDTDIGTEVDRNAITLAYLLANPEAELLGITTVTGEAYERAKLASVLCKITGKGYPYLAQDVRILNVVPQIELYAPQKKVLINAHTQFQQAVHYAGFRNIRRVTLSVCPYKCGLCCMVRNQF